MRELGLFSGAGGFALAGRLLGWRSIGYVDVDEWCCRTIVDRIEDGTFAPAPVFCTDLRDFVRFGYSRNYRGMVDVVTAGFPCQPFSVAGKMFGEDDPRNMWPATVAALREIRPEWVFLENVANIRCPTRRKNKLVAPSYLGRVFGDLAAIGFDLAWDCLRAPDVGAPHKKRDRIWIVAHAHTGHGCQNETIRTGGNESVAGGADIPDADHDGRPGDVELDRAAKTRGNGKAGHDTERFCQPLSDADGGLRPAGHEPTRRQARSNAGWGSCRPELGAAAGVGCYARALGESRTIDEYAAAMRAAWWAAEPGVRRVAYGVADQSHRLRALGQGVIPAVAAAAWRVLSLRLRPESANQREGGG